MTTDGCINLMRFLGIKKMAAHLKNVICVIRTIFTQLLLLLLFLKRPGQILNFSILRVGTY